jgi:hypothetical protein
MDWRYGIEAIPSPPAFRQNRLRCGSASQAKIRRIRVLSCVSGMPLCSVSVLGNDGTWREQLVEASTVHDTVAKAYESIARFWWFTSQCEMVVRPLRPAGEYRLSAQMVQQVIRRKRKAY